jgi:O-antigen ligase
VLNLRVPEWFKALTLLLFLLPLMAGLSLLMASDVNRHLTRTRGVENGLSADLPALNEPRLGINVALETYPDEPALRGTLVTMQALGMGTLRQRFAWADLEPAPGDYRWEQWDRVLPVVHEYGLQVIAVLDTSPAWARTDWEADNIYAPPTNPEDFARFADAFARRYGEYITAYQVWDQPNIFPHWGKGEIDPAGYVTLLRAANGAIREADPDGLVIAGGLSPNVESGGRNMSDVQYLREIYRRGAGEYFDVLGVQAYGFWSGPHDRRVDPDVLNFSRVILLREEMVRRGDAHKPVWALEGGWCALPADWAGQPSPQGSDIPPVQVARMKDALARAQQEWPWMGLISLSHWRPNAPADDPIWGYALVDPENRPNVPLEQLYREQRTNITLYPGFSPINEIYLEALTRRSGLFSNGWAEGESVTPLTVEVPFWGTSIALDVDGGQLGEALIAWTDESEPVTVELGDEPVTVASRLHPGPHQLSLYGTPKELGTIRGIRVAAQPRIDELLLGLAVGLVILLWGGISAGRAIAVIPWRAAWGWVRGRWLGTPGWWQVAALVGAWALVWLAPTAMIRLAALALYGLVALLRPDLALLVAVACIPLAPLHVRVGPGSFSLTELSLLVAVAARVGQVILVGPAEKRNAPRQSLLHSLHPLDYMVALLALLGLGTCFLAEYQRVAFREWRVVVLESALLYGLLRTQARHSALRLVDVLWLSGVAVALYALAVYPRPDGVIEAEGVRRARAFYGSPNNLALYLERLLPLGLALAAWGGSRWRRWLYGLGSVPVALALALTFSRGAWIMGLPAGLLALGWARGGRARWAAVAVVVVAALVLVPLAGTERFASLLDLSQGTSFLRVSLWQAAWDMARAHPWLGVGLDNFLYYYGDYIRPGAEVDRWLSHPHNLLLDFWLRLGIGGLVLVVGLLGVFIARAWRQYRALPDGDRRAVALGLLAGMAAFVAHGMIDASYFVVELACWFTFALAWVANADATPLPQPAQKPEALPEQALPAKSQR